MKLVGCTFRTAVRPLLGRILMTSGAMTSPSQTPMQQSGSP